MYRKPKRPSCTAARTTNRDTQVPPPRDARNLIDRFGHKHLLRLLTMWSPAVLKAMGVRRIEVSREGSKRA